jgi:hypothetical protein
MIYIEVSGDADLRDEVIAVATKSTSGAKISDEQGFDGIQLVQIVLDEGPKVVALITAVLEMIEAGKRLRKSWTVKIGNEAPKRKSRK